MSLLAPQSIAIIGASADEKKVGHLVLKNLMSQGFAGEIYPVNPKQAEILGKTSYPSMSDIPGDVDIAVVVTPASTVNAIAEECGTKGVKTMIVISAGFGETGTTEGKKMEEELVATVTKHNIALVGPNCLGVLRPSVGMNASFAENVEKPGGVALLSQSGALAVAVMDAAKVEGLAFSLVVSMGNKAAMDECDFLELCAEDSETHVIGMYLESINDGRRFLEVAAHVAVKKPIVLIKSGTSARGKSAVSSHTGALAGSDAAITAACAQAGIRHAKTTEEFIDMVRVLSMQPALLSPAIAVITNAGGPGILATDAAEREKVILAELSVAQKVQLAKALPSAASIKNPIDVLGDALGDRYGAALDACSKDAGVDGVAVLLTPQVMTPAAEIAKEIARVSRLNRLMPVVTSFMGDENVREAIEILHANGIPNFPTPERAIAALAALKNLGSAKPKIFGPAKRASKEFDGVHGLLSEEQTEELFGRYAIPLPSGAVARDADEAVTFARKIGYPVVAKISSPQILHKTDIGCVKVRLTNDDEVRAAFEEILGNAKKHAPKAEIKGVLIQKMLAAGDEFIVGSIRDASFGHLVMAGLGGVYTELFRDTAFRVAPIVEEDAFTMLQELQSWKMLLGLRGKAQADIEALARVIEAVSRLVTENPRIVELDLNPVIVRPDGVVVADAKVVLD